MPVIGTPISNADACSNEPTLPGGQPGTPTPVSCVGQNVLVPNSPAEPVKGTPLLAKTQAFKVNGKQKATLDYTMRDVRGVPVDLRTCLCIADSSSSIASSQSASMEAECDYQVEFRLQEYIGRANCPTPIVAKTIYVPDADAAIGRVRIELSPDDTAVPGVYFGEVALVEPSTVEGEDSVVVFSNHFYVHVGRNLWTGRMSGAAPLGPPSVAEIRMHLRDTDPAESFLLDNLKFDDAEIAQATWLSVEEWNETPPPIGTYNTATFPFRYHWLMAIAGHLFLVAAEHQRANNLTYAASGVSINDMDKEPNYEAAAARRLQQWREWMKRKKAEINLSNAYGGIGSDYGYDWRY